MAISIQTNVNSLVAQQNLSVTNKFQSQTITQLTSGYRINQSGDDAAGLAVANKFRSTVAELTQGVANGNDATAQLQIMDGGMSNISQILDRLKTLATQSASGTFTGNRATLNSEFQTDIAEIDRQAQSIGLDTGGFFAKSLSVYLGQGSGSGGGNGGSLALANASVSVDLSSATVDAGSLGLKGMKAIAGSVGATGTDIGTGSINGTTVQDIVSSSAGNAQAKAGYATFHLSGPGFSDDSKVSVSANLSGVSDTATLVTAINQAIANAAGGSSQADQALKSAGIVATVNTDQYGHQQLAFSSSTTAFQVQAGDQMANALMGNFAAEGSATGKAVSSTVTGGTAGVATAAFNPTNVSVQISGAGLGSTVNLSLNSADIVVSDATADLIKQVNQNKQLQDAGISAALTSDNKLQFTSATGASFNVSSVGDTTNALGLGTFVTTSALNGAASYSDITASTGYSAAAKGNGVATLGFSLNGGATGGITAATVTGSVTGVGYNGGGTPNGTVGNALGALGTMTIALNGSSTPVTVDFALDANQSATETVQQAADFINSQIQAQAGYGSDVKLATVDSATNTIVLSGPADGARTVAASGAAATALGLTAASGATSVAASGSAGNTVSVNLAGGNATSGVAVGSAAAPTNVATGTTATMALNIDGVVVNANFANDVNAAGKAAEMTSSKLAADAAGTVDVSALQGGAASLSSASLGALGVDTVKNVSTNFTATQAAFTASTGAVKSGGGVTSADADNVDLAAFAAAKATHTGAALGVIANPDLTSLNLSQFAATAAKAIGGTLGADANAAVDLSAFAATKATATSGTMAATGLDFSAFNATQAEHVGTAVAEGTGSMTSVLSGLTDSLTITISDGTTTRTSSINIAARTDLADVAAAINGDTGAGGLNEGGAGSHILATATNGVLTIANVSPAMTAGAANTINVVANDSSKAIGLAGAAQIADTEAAGVNATTLNLTVDTVAADKAATTTGTTNLPATGLDFSALNVAETAIMSGTKVAATNGTTVAAISALTGVQTLDINIDGGPVANVDLSACNTLTDVVNAIQAEGIANLTASAVNGVLVLTNDKAPAAGNQVVVVQNEAALAVGLSTTAAGGNKTVSGHTYTGLKVQVDGLAQVDVDISGLNTAAAVATAIGTAINALDNTYVIADTAKVETDGSITITGKTAGAAGHVTVQHNAASLTLGFTFSEDSNTTGALSHTDTATVAVDLTGKTTLNQVRDQINNTVKALDSTYGNVAVANANGTITLSGATGGAASTVNIDNSALSNFLGFTSGTADSNNQGVDATKLKVAIDGLGERDIDVSGATTVGQVAQRINAALVADSPDGYGSSYGTVASGNTGNLVLTSALTGGGAHVNILGNAVSQALGLTTGGQDNNNQGVNATKLLMNVDNLGQVGVTVSSGVTDLNSLIAAINTQTNNAVGAGGFGSNTIAALGTATGTLKLTGIAANATGNVTIEDNAVSRLLGLTTSGQVSKQGSDATKLTVQIDGGNAVAVDLTASGTMRTITQIKGDINTAVNAAYGTSGTNYAVSASGVLGMTGVASGGSLKITNNALSNHLALTTGTADTVKSRADQTLNLQIDGHQQVAIALDGLGTAAKLSDIATAINNALSQATSQGYGAAYGNVATANSDGTITLTGVTGSGTLNVINSTMSNFLGMTTSTSNATNTGSAAQLLDISIDGQTTAHINFSGITGGGTPTLTDIAAAINTELSAAYGAGYDQLAQANSDGTITIASKGTGSVDGKVEVTNNAAGKLLGLTTGSASSVIQSGTDESLADVVSFLNATAQKALGTSTAANVVSLDANGAINIASQTKGANSSVSVLSSGTTAGLAASLNLDVDQAATGQARSLQSVVDDLNVAFNTNSTLQQAGLTAEIKLGSLEVSSANGTLFRVAAWGTQSGTSDSDLGFGDTGQAFTNANALTPKSTASVIDTQGSSAIGTFANTKNSASISFQNMQFGNDDQSITISANSAAGVAQTPLTITLQNDDQAQTGSNVDAAISAINAKLQQSESATMRSITAVSETAADGSESINFISSLSSFNVSVSSSAGAAVGDGLNGGMAKTFTSAMNGSSSSIAIDTQAGAQQAVLALSAAVAKLGSSQASIGRGVNQLAYAINLAQSQITSFSSAESQIRDTNVAAQAANLSKAQVLSQASIAAMAQANSAPQAVLALLRG